MLARSIRSALQGRAFSATPNPAQKSNNLGWILTGGLVTAAAGGAAYSHHAHKSHSHAPVRVSVETKKSLVDYQAVAKGAFLYHSLIETRRG
jgi:hypothetical protein